MNRLLQAEPDNPFALNIAGSCLSALGRPGEAEQCWESALAANPDYAEVHYNLGNLRRNTGRPAEAEASYRRAIESNPGLAEAHNNLGILLQALGRWPEAEAAYGQALEIRPAFPQACYNLGNLFQDSRRLPEAEKAYRHALQLNSRYPEALYNLGIILQETGRLQEAESAYRRAVELVPRYAGAHYNLGLLLYGLKRYAEAEASFRQVLALSPGHAETLNNLGAALKELKRHGEAETALRQALSSSPDYAEAHNNLGMVLHDTNRFAEAEPEYRRALELRPDYAEAQSNLGMVFQEERRLAEAEAAYRRALELQPGYAEARFNLGMLLLRSGRWAEGWSHYEARYHPGRVDSRITPPRADYPQWQGESLAGRSILVWPEQGFGDEIQFVRYVPLLKARGAGRVTLVCRPALQPLFEGIEGVDTLATTDDLAKLPAHDCWTYLLSLPFHLGIDPEAGATALPYLQPRQERVAAWAKKLPKAPVRVGLVWKGSVAHGNDRNRSLPGLSALAPLWKVPGVAFVSLQKGQGEKDAKAPPAGQPVAPLGSDIRDFADSAALVSQLDLVVTVDTSMAHLAGALGKPCWVLLPRTGTDWRWQDGRTDSPWYPGVMRLFRQEQVDDWAGVVRQVADALRDFRPAG